MLYTVRKGTSLTKILLNFIEYRTPMAIKEYMEGEKVETRDFGEYTNFYAICPRCGSRMDWERQEYCEDCGQHLQWVDKKKMRLVKDDGNKNHK